MRTGQIVYNYEVERRIWETSDQCISFIACAGDGGEAIARELPRDDERLVVMNKTGARRWIYSIIATFLTSVLMFAVAIGYSPRAHARAYIYSGYNDVSCDSAGNPFAVGFDAYMFYSTRAIVTKFSGADGRDIWGKESEDYEETTGVSCDRSDNPVVTGYISWPRIIVTTKYRGSNGAVLWTKTHDSGSDETYAPAVSCDPDGNPVVAGMSAGKIWVRKYGGSDGATIWTKTFSSGAARGVSCDGSGNPVVVGRSGSGEGAHLWVAKLSSADGTALWSKSLTQGEAAAVSCDGNGNAVVAGYTGTQNDSDIWVAKFSGSNGATLWSNSVKDGMATGVSCDGNGNAVVVGWNADNAWIRKYGGSKGATIWITTETGCRFTGVSCDASGNPVVAGINCEGSDPDPGVSFISSTWIGKYGGSNGEAVWIPTKENTCSTWYLAEGTTSWGFSTYISIENPNTEAVTAGVTYMTTEGEVNGGALNLPASSQTTITNDALIAAMGGEKDFSTEVRCMWGKTIAVDRTMSWTGPGALSPEGHCSVGVTSPNQTWYLPEGSSSWGFECWLLIQNPNDTEATATVTYMIEDEEPQSFEKKVPASSRATFNMADDIGAKDVSIKVTSDKPVIPERAMYRNNRRSGHDSVGTTTPAFSYYLAEGTTAWGFTTYVLVQNPNDTPADVTVTYMTGGGAVPQAPFRMEPNSRKTIRVNDVLPDEDLSTQVHGSQPIIAERAMYWDNGTGEACHDSIGMSSPHKTFYLPNGETLNGRETWILVQNPNTADVTVEITYLTPDGKGNVTKTEKIPANSRKTFNMLEHSGITGRASIMVTSKTEGKKIMVERAMYWNNRGAGTDTIGGYSD